MEGPPADEDAVILAEAFSDGRLLLTEVHDFGALAVRDGRASCGVVLIELYGLSEELRNARVISVIERGETELAGRFTVIEPSRTRSRPIIP
jgi:hypothetical protein